MIIFIIIFLKVALKSLINLMDINTIIMLVMSFIILIFLIQISDIFIIYLSIVAVSLCLYPLITLDKKSHGNTEAVAKYFFLGAVASGIMLYGISLIYRETNTLSYKDLRNLNFSDYFNNNDASSFVLLTGFIFIIFGFFF